MVAGHVPEARACSIVSTIPEALPPQGFVSFTIYLFLQSCLIGPYLQSPLAASRGKGGCSCRRSRLARKRKPEVTVILCQHAVPHRQLSLASYHSNASSTEIDYSWCGLLYLEDYDAYGSTFTSPTSSSVGYRICQIPLPDFRYGLSRSSASTPVAKI